MGSVGSHLFSPLSVRGLSVLASCLLRSLARLDFLVHDDPVLLLPFVQSVPRARGQAIPSSFELPSSIDSESCLQRHGVLLEKANGPGRTLLRRRSPLENETNLLRRSRLRPGESQLHVPARQGREARQVSVRFETWPFSSPTITFVLRRNEKKTSWSLRLPDESSVSNASLETRRTITPDVNASLAGTRGWAFGLIRASRTKASSSSLKASRARQATSEIN